MREITVEEFFRERQENNMIFRYELKKIFQKKVNLITMLAGYIILMITTIYPVMNESEYLFQKELELKGIEALRYHENFAENQTGEFTEEYVTNVLRELKESNIDPNTDEGYLTLDDRYGYLFHYLVKSYQPIGDDSYQPEFIFRVGLDFLSGPGIFRWA